MLVAVRSSVAAGWMGGRRSGGLVLNKPDAIRARVSLRAGLCGNQLISTPIAEYSAHIWASFNSHGMISNQSTTFQLNIHPQWYVNVATVNTPLSSSN